MPSVHGPEQRKHIGPLVALVISIFFAQNSSETRGHKKPHVRLPTERAERAVSPRPASDST